jgi:hypothetical protein
MLRYFLAATLVSLAWLAAAAPLGQDERNRAMSHLHATRKLFLDSVQGLSDAQWRFKPSPDTWSVAECAEHIAVTEDMLFQLVTEKVLKAPPAPEKMAAVAGKDELVMRVVPDRGKKFQAPEALRPTSRWPTEAALVASFKQSRDRSTRFVQSTE